MSEEKIRRYGNQVYVNDLEQFEELVSKGVYVMEAVLKSANTKGAAYNLSVKHVESDKSYRPVFSVPSSSNESVALDAYYPEEPETLKMGPCLFRASLDRLGGAFALLVGEKQKSLGGDKEWKVREIVPEHRRELKWPYKTLTRQEYMAKFDGEMMRHAVLMDNAWASSDGYITVSLTMSRFPGKTLKGVREVQLAAREAKKRRIEEVETAPSAEMKEESTEVKA